MPRYYRDLPVWLKTNAWREIFARIFEGLDTKFNVSPEWLINPATNRRLKLDLLYPQIGLAVRFEGLQGKNRRQRPSLEEEIQQQTRDNARVEMCAAHGIELIAIDAAGENVKKVFQEIDLRLSRTGRQANNAGLGHRLRQARTTAASIARNIKSDDDLKLYADLWEDRQYQLAEPETVTAPARATVAFTTGMEVEHPSFGPGVVLAVDPSDNDTLVTVDFITAGQKTLVASLVAGKLLPR